jgi:hypothetical protein
MILPYLATALLILVTAYAATVSFRRRVEGAPPGVIFPNGARRSARILVGLSTFALAVGLIAWSTIGGRNPTRGSLRFLIPEGYWGWVRVEFEVPNEPLLPQERGQTVLKIPPSGVLKTSSPEQYGWAKDSYSYYSGAGERPLPDSGHGSVIWGKMNGAESGSSGKREYEEFFVGTEQQYKDQAKGEDKKKGPQ